MPPEVNDSRQTYQASLPRKARLPVNRCNLPAIILGGLQFQKLPTALFIDGVHEFHAQLFESLDGLADPVARAANFQDYMRACFLLDNLDEAGLNSASPGIKRGRAHYLRLLRGWMFDADSIEGAVLKGWVESRFGLLTRYHRGPLDNVDSDSYQHFQAARARGIYNTNALESQIDLLYSFCQYELSRRFQSRTHLALYRGSNAVTEYDELFPVTGRIHIKLLNNLSSFTDKLDQADSFGDVIFRTDVPLAKLLYFPGLLPGVLTGENEYLVIGGVYRMTEVANHQG